MTALCTMLLAVEGLTCPLLPADPATPPNQVQMYAVLDRAGWPESLWEEAAAVAYCESRWTPGVRNGVHLGLYQINFFWDSGGNPDIFSGWARWVRETYGETGDPLDPIFNAWVARLIYERNNGWQHNWPNCRPDRLH